MSLSARAKAVRGVGYSRLLQAVHGLLELAVQPPAQPPSYGGPWAAGRSHTISRRAPTAAARRTRRQREIEFFLVHR
jgi:hypothetical protein